MKTERDTETEKRKQPTMRLEPHGLARAGSRATAGPVLSSALRHSPKLPCSEPQSAGGSENTEEGVKKRVHQHRAEGQQGSREIQRRAKAEKNIKLKSSVVCVGVCVVGNDVHSRQKSHEGQRPHLWRW